MLILHQLHIKHGDAILNISGSGTIKCYGGDAGDGGDGGRNNLDWAAGAGGGAGAGIGGNGRKWCIWKELCNSWK